MCPPQQRHAVLPCPRDPASAVRLSLPRDPRRPRLLCVSLLCAFRDVPGAACQGPQRSRARRRCRCKEICYEASAPVTTESGPLTVRHLQPGTQETRGVVPSDGQAGGGVSQASPRARQRPAPQLQAARLGAPSYSACFRPSADGVGAPGPLCGSAPPTHENAQKRPCGHAQDV